MRFFLLLFALVLCACSTVSTEKAPEPVSSVAVREIYSYLEIPDKPVVIIPATSTTGLNLSNSESIGKYIDDAFQQSKRFSIVERDSLELLLEEMNLQLSGITSGDDAVQVGRLLNAQKVILTSVSRSGSISLSESEEQFLLSVETVDIETAEIEDSFTNICSGLSGIYRNVDEYIQTIVTAAPVYGTIQSIQGNSLIATLESELSSTANSEIRIESVVERIKDSSGTITFEKSAVIATGRIISNQSTVYEIEIKDGLSSGFGEGFIFRCYN